MAGDALVALAAEPGADAGSLSSGRVLPDAAADPWVARRHGGWRRLWRLDVEGHAALPISPEGYPVWELAARPGGGFVVVCSDEPGEDGWYRPRLGLVGDDPSAEPVILHESRWQLSSPAVSPDGRRIAFAEGWASDRGLLAGDVRVVDAAGGVVEPLDAGVDVTWLRWTDDGRLWFAGWDHLGTAWGWFDAPGSGAAPSVHREAAGCLNSRLHPEVVPLGDDTALTTRSTADTPPQVVRLSAGSAPRPWTAFNVGLAERRRFGVQELRWASEENSDLDGLVALPRSGPGPWPLVVDILEDRASPGTTAGVSPGRNCSPPRATPC